MIERRVPLVLASIIVVVLGAGLGHTYLVAEPRVEAQVTAAVESRGGEVVRIVHAPRRPRGPGYVDIVLDGQPTRCSLALLKKDPPVFQCDPAVNVK